MPRLSSEIKEQIKNLDTKELQEIVLKMAAKEKLVYDFVVTNYLNKEYGEEELFEETKDDLEMLSLISYKGISVQIRVAKMLGNCIKRINEFTKVSKNKKYEAELLMYALQFSFSLPPNEFGTCFTVFDSKTAITLKRLINIVTNQLHPDYQADYAVKINEYLKILHLRSNHIDTVYHMPKSI